MQEITIKIHTPTSKNTKETISELLDTFDSINKANWTIKVSECPE